LTKLQCSNRSRRNKSSNYRIELTVKKLLLEALEEKDPERAVELFLAARLIKTSHENMTGSS